MEAIPETPITKFYNGKTILLTGATGFVGKVFLEKILYSTNVKKVYVVVREKRGQAAHARVEALISSPVFSGPNRVKKEILLQKIGAIFGDLSVDGLKLSAEDKTKIVDEVNIVMHCAASVKFDDPIKEALNINYIGTRSLARLSHEITNLDSFVHVSTCFSNCHINFTEEKIYPTRLSGDELLQMAEYMPEQELETFCRDRLYEGRPNSYTFTKALAENMVHTTCSDIPTAIARLSVVTGGYFEPEPGFTDTASAANFVGLAQGLGAIRTYNFKPDCHADGVPVDTVVNALIAIAKEVAIEKPPLPKIYNIAAGRQHTEPVQGFYENCDIIAHQYPSSTAFRPPPLLAKPPTRLGYLYSKYVLELFYAFIFDLAIGCVGGKREAFSKMRWVCDIREALQPFHLNDSISFDITNYLQLVDSLSKEDYKLFMSDIRHIVKCFKTGRLDYGVKVWLCMRKYKLKEDVSEAGQAKARRWLKILKVREVVINVGMHIFIGCLLYAFYYVLTTISSTLVMAAF